MKTLTFVSLLLSTAIPLLAEERILFNRDVRPILADHCLPCHGFDANARQSGLRLDVREQALQPAESGSVPIVPLKPADSELIRRVTAHDDSQMPPPSFNKALSTTQIEILRQWIAEGAEFQRHWAFEPLVKPEIPEREGHPHPIDAFVAASLQKHDLTLSPEASRETLLRRVSFALTGLPPTLEELDRIDESYEQAVDRLLASPHFGERMAVVWLDAARYADTNGYFSDKPRQMWLWRNWVIDAFNQNMPFDQFTIEQLAGDLLPDATVPQKIATGFNRNHVANNETGIIDEEFRTEYVVDRVDTTMTTWMGLTAGCAQCHDHKFDPISQREFYQLFAFFNNVPETGLIVTDNPPPLIKVSTPEQDQHLADLSHATAIATQTFEAIRETLTTRIAAWEADALRTLPVPPQDSLVCHEAFDGQLATGTQSVGTTLMFQKGILREAAKFDATQHAERKIRNFDPDAAWSIGFWMLPDGSLSCPLSKIEPDGARRGLELLWQKGRLSVNLVSQWGSDAIEVTTLNPVNSGAWHQYVISYDGSHKANGLRIFVDGTPAEIQIHRDVLAGSIRNDKPLLIGRRDGGLGSYGHLDELRILQRTFTTQEVADWFHAERIRGIVESPASSRGGRETDVLLDYFIHHHADEAAIMARSNLQAARREEQAFRESIPTTLVMQEMPKPRETHVLLRGVYNQPGELVKPDVPAAISAWPADAPRNRLGFAQWLMADENPLTARVAVNRLWMQCFGEGLVRTPNDFGTQGEAPTHPELLDWLSVTYRELDWDTKAVLRLIVTSQTYRQQSTFRVQHPVVNVSGDPFIVDPQNRLLSRGPAFRMSAEMIRDQALAVSGLLQRQIGGPSVKPYQPEGLWEEVSYGSEDTYIEDTGNGLWRRSLYTYLKRQLPPPSLLAFDGTTREKCTVQRARTNTPLQALILLNDPTYIEAARSLAGSILQSNVNENAGIELLFRKILCRVPHDDEIAPLLKLLQRQRVRFQTDVSAAAALLQVGASEPPAGLDSKELAAWAIVAHTILNLDEAITHR
ncbi:MAG: DUF1553 domain-containing protein [Planctomycetaceae bacterium]|nr:DUF1553 domain-containing protein [Planctomycetaceae bacterium]